MPKLKDITGQTIGLWKVMRYFKDARKWECLCTGCNKIFNIYSGGLLSGKSTRCRRCGYDSKLSNRTPTFAAVIASKVKGCAFVMLPDAVYALVSKKDLNQLSKYNWCLDNDGYASTRTNTKGKLISMHRLLVTAPNGKEIDHKNRIILDNRRTNLRFATRSQNNANSPVRASNRNSKFKGVRRNGKSGNTFQAYGGLNGRQQYIGCFKTELEAAVAYNQWASKTHGKFACLNPI